MEIILIAVLVIGVIAFIAYPLFNTPRAEILDAPNALESLAAQRDSTYDAIRDLDFDFQMGKLSQSDYAMMREKYKARAAVALQQIDAVGDHGNGAPVEEQAAQPRAAKRTAAPADDAIEREIARLRAGKSAASDLRCANCGTPYHAGDTFCAKCGNRLTTKDN